MAQANQSKKKKQPKNAFYFFMVDYKSKQENKGKRFPGGLKEVADKAAPIWKALGPDDKFIYEEEARREKERDKSNLENKFTTQGKSYAQVEREKNEQLEQYSKMMNEIQSTVNSLDAETTLTTYPFHIIHVNYYCRQENGVYTPCEIALAEFNFAEGVRRTYHTLINPGQIPLGYKYEAVSLSKETHQIPVPPDEFGGETDYYKVFTNVKRFVMGKKGKYLFPYYTRQDSVDAVKSVLSKLQEDFSEKIEFRIYPLTTLFFELRNACVSVQDGQGFPAYSLAERELDRDVFNFTRGISCEFHEETDALPYCSLSCVKRWSYLIMDHCCMDLGIDLKPGQHCPMQADVSHHRKLASRPTSVAGDRIISNDDCSDSNSESGWIKHTDSGSTTTVKEEKPLAPCRLPKTRPEAFTVVGDGKNYEDDFPAIGVSKRRPLEGEPVPVAGRGRMMQPRLTNPITLGRGRSLVVNLKEEDLKNLNLE
ncbi:hypothetical protein L9F63_007218 [Diploptera punctata]|uniref:HMG box domain-containing protein n=1 Tax=Diploptera punctata TaxID=6984 RepID=A0AAD8E3W4_DIPPU|nr:hypothetical protein L9F63_007218 [Diploptera punctata]